MIEHYDSRSHNTIRIEVKDGATLLITVTDHGIDEADSVTRVCVPVDKLRTLLDG